MIFYKVRLLHYIITLCIKYNNTISELPKTKIFFQDVNKKT